MMYSVLICYVLWNISMVWVQNKTMNDLGCGTWISVFILHSHTSYNFILYNAIINYQNTHNPNKMLNVLEVAIYKSYKQKSKSSSKIS